MTLHTYLPQDRLRALARGETLPDRTQGSALFADISGFTPLTEALRESLGPRRGAEELTKHLYAVYTALIAEVERYGGSVTGFAGDAMTCWFDDTHGSAAPRATACAFALQHAMSTFAAIALPNGAIAMLSLKVAVASGPARRFAVGDPEIYYLDALAGVTVVRTATAEHLAQKGEVLLDEASVQALGVEVTVREWLTDNSDERFAVLTQFTGEVTEPAFPDSVPVLDATTLQGWVHSLVVEREQSGQGAFLTEFRPCVALFVRFMGIDYDAAEAETQLDTFIRQAQSLARQYESTLLDLTIGDKGSYFYLNFAALSVHEDDARRAVKVALELQSAASQLGFLSPLQIGITQGLMLVGAYGGPTRSTYGALGDDVNLAARLMQTAAPGEILLSGRVQKATANDFVFEPRPPLPMKGKAEPLPVFAVTGERQQRPIRLQEPQYSLPMVGRQAELQTIAEKLDLALNGQAQIIGIVAEAGMGKSRLVAEVIRNARRKGFAGYGGACQSDAINIPYHAWKPIWSAFFDVDPSAPLRKQIRLLEGEIEDRAPERVQALPLLGHLLNLNIPDNDFTKTLEPKDRKGALHALLEDCLKASTRDEPLLLVIEDLHWIDALSHDLLEELVRAMTNHRICFVLAYRPPQLQRLQAPRLEGLPAFTKIELSELTVAECEQAIRAKLAQLYPSRSGAVPPMLVEKLMARAQGNPFFLEELLNFLRDRGLDPRDPADLNKIELPDSLHTLILSRIDQLTEHEKSTLRVASIIGRLFRAAWLTGYYPSLGELPQVKADLDELNALDITPLDTPEPELAYLFKHIVTHEVTYESLPFATRARLHELLAGYLETIAAPLETIAHHYGQSDNTAKQREYWQRAGQAAQVAFANEAALDYFSRLLPLLDDPRSQLDVYLKRSAVRELLGKWAEAEADQRAALVLGELAGDAAAVARCRQALGKLFRLRGDFAAALSWLAQASDGFTALDDRTGLAWTRIEMGIVWWQKGEYASARHELETGLALARALADPTPAALALNNLGNVESDQGDYAAGQALYEQSLAHSREMGDKRGIAAGLGNLGALAAGQGNYVAAQALYEESLALFREIGDKRGIAVSLVNLGALAFYQGDYAAARALCDESLALFREMGDKRGIALSVINLGHLLLEQGDAASAQTAFRESLTLLQEVGDKNSMFYGFAGLAAVAAHQANAPRAAHLAAAAETLRSSLGAAWDMVEGRIFAGAVAAARAALSEAEFNAAWEAGSKMTLDEAVELALN